MADPAAPEKDDPDTKPSGQAGPGAGSEAGPGAVSDAVTIGMLTPGKRSFMFILGIASGMPYVIFTGTLIAWLTEGGVTTSTIGVLSWAGLAYAFKFLWSPLISAINLPILPRAIGMGGLRRWMIACQAVIVASLVLISGLDPSRGVAIVALLAVLSTFASATQDIAIDAWRIRAAETSQMLDTLSTVVQLGYRSAVFIGGSGMLIYADIAGWGQAWIFVSIAMAICLASVFFIPDAEGNPVKGAARALPERRRVTLGVSLGKEREKFVWPVLAVWVTCLIILFGFMFYMVTAESPPSTRNFTLFAGPFIVAACVGAPVIAAIMILKRDPHPTGGEAPASGATDLLYTALLEPMIDLVYRLRYAAILILALVLTYRYADTVWGAFAYPFYLGAPETGGLAYTLSEIAFASKIFGVLMTITGTALAGFIIAGIGRMRALVIGGILAAATNLLYAELAVGGARVDAFIDFVHFDIVYGPLQAAANWLYTTPILDAPITIDDRIGRLLLVIAGENLVVGFASVAYVAYLSSIVNKHYAAVQYALLASLTMLIGVLGRGYLGELIENRGYAFVFILTAVLGLVGVAASVGEWLRQARIGVADKLKASIRD
ncbi:AmpG family muropeptide MFS transporter [Aquisalinus flavus]|uniref:MFS transporter n=1 Tax=Aquisalinus flavus TaxID=1526572 RepID=A0A8J2Y5L3_9PROT|nr:hypothetical protein [Aquisalinus flavus]MBD0425622.1 hypothetical protein [Aquisalinus flavus]UNE48760.1 AmpG family muropeptide MFS transporter [Aquisalinus flavus]GGD14555.1 hypothetical protein GCM10011342_24200 [Aquisalinus flavus]